MAHMICVPFKKSLLSQAHEDTLPHLLLEDRVDSCSGVFCLFFFLPHSVACSILVSHPRIEPAPPAVETHILNHWATREVQHL